MAYRPIRRALRDGAMHDEGALYDFLYNVREFLNVFSGGTWTLEKQDTAVAPTLAATAAELNNVADISARAVSAGSSLILTEATHAERLIKLDTATGSTVTLPAATGSGARYYFAVTVLATSNSHKIQVANATDVMRGVMLNTDSDTSDAFTGFNTTSTSDTITLNRSTTGSVYIGEFIEIWDIKAGFFSVRGWYASTGSPATPFSAAV
jgi:hypothetical protein